MFLLTDFFSYKRIIDTNNTSKMLQKIIYCENYNSIMITLLKFLFVDISITYGLHKFKWCKIAQMVLVAVHHNNKNSICYVPHKVIEH